jgi:hypothetical protein
MVTVQEIMMELEFQRAVAVLEVPLLICTDAAVTSSNSPSTGRRIQASLIAPADQVHNTLATPRRSTNRMDQWPSEEEEG